MVVLDDRVVKGRRNHRCFECSCLILKGSAHRRQVYTDGGCICTYRAHTDCAELALETRDRDRDPDDPLPLYEAIEPTNYVDVRSRYPEVAVRLGIMEKTNGSNKQSDPT